MATDDESIIQEILELCQHAKNKVERKRETYLKRLRNKDYRKEIDFNKSISIINYDPILFQFCLHKYNTLLNDNILTRLFEQEGESIGHLDLSKCKYFTIDGLIDQFVRLPKLQSLKMQFSRQVDASSIARLLENTHSTFSHLDISCNMNLHGSQFVGAPLRVNPHISSITVMHSHLNDEDGVALFSALSGNSGLLHLNASFNQLGDESVRLLARMLECAGCKIKTLNLATNQITDDSMDALIDAIVGIDTLSELDISSNRIGERGGVSIGQRLIPHDRSLRTLVLASNDIGPDAGMAIGQGLATPDIMIESLNLAHTLIGDDGAMAIAGALHSNRSLKHLDLSFNCLENDAGCAIGAAIAKNQAVTTLLLKRNQFGEHTVKVIGDALKTNTSLTLLDLSGNQIGLKGAKSLAFSLPLNKTLADLDLSYNLLGDAGGKLIGDCLATNAGLVRLNLAANRIGVETCKSISQSLKNSNLQFNHLPSNQFNLDRQDIPIIIHYFLRNKKSTFLTSSSPNIHHIASGQASLSKLRWICLDCNRVGDEGAIVLSEVIANNSTLKSISLTNNHIGERGGKAIGESLMMNTKLINLQLDSNLIGPVGAKSIGDALRRNTTLQSLGLSGNRIEDDGGRAINDALCDNNSLKALMIRNNSFGQDLQSLIESLPQISEIY
ncbi:hypothetical protein DFA_05431 [Cavenderia fasciculata]|uniref:Leucine-rich repeat-containing protein n=1 Tax=Cavenderia fasciculata TaxID=261658 RepID=F4PL77_CACFS|nr:uncharacterized protein DFA_05431 [Cavenderia fasciculata]EGG23299.1 hypothetical protein DFA_05431 [Cavenderia fasciculata]|eukprot:XP_004361150.1 hypothetical protein DFA_05431 [Cavenderia fasciculata]